MADKFDLNDWMGRWGVAIPPAGYAELVSRIRALESASQPGGGEAEERAAQIADDVCAKSRNHLFRSAAKIIASKIRDSAPERIYLVVGDVKDETEFARLTDVTWCEDSQFDTDIEYVHIDRAAPSAGNGGVKGTDK